MYSIEQRDEQLLNTSAGIRYHCYFKDAHQHVLHVRMEVDTKDKELLLVLPSWTPGSYKIREFVSHLGNLKVRSKDGEELAHEWQTKNTLHIENGDCTTVVVEYTYYANERTVRTMHINRWRAFINPVNCMMYVDGRMNEIHHVHLHHNQTEWYSLSTALSPVHEITIGTDPVVVGALNYDILADSPIEIGTHQTASFTACGAKHDVALVAPIKLDIEWLSEQCKKIVETEAKIFNNEVPYDRYVFMVQVGYNVYGGLEHSSCSVNLVDIATMTDANKKNNLLTLLCHEYFHTWNIKRIRPVEYGPFDYINECYSPQLWLAEGFTSYYDDLLAYRTGYMSEQDYIDNVAAEHFGKLARVPGRFAMSTRDSSYLAWVKLYAQSPDGNNRFPSYYLKGGVISLLMELYVIAQSNGTKRLDDGMRELWRLYLEQPHKGTTERETFDALEKATGVELYDRFMALLNGTEEIDYNTYLQPFGLQWSFTPYKEPSSTFALTKTFSGLGLKDEAGKAVVATVEDGSPAFEAGIGIDDEIVAVNGIRTSSANAVTEALHRNGIEKHAEITAVCDGTLYNTTIKPQPIYKSEILFVVNPTEQQTRLLEFWLQR